MEGREEAPSPTLLAVSRPWRDSHPQDPTLILELNQVSCCCSGHGNAEIKALLPRMVILLRTTFAHSPACSLSLFRRYAALPSSRLSSAKTGRDAVQLIGLWFTSTFPPHIPISTAPVCGSLPTNILFFRVSRIQYQSTRRFYLGPWRGYRVGIFPHSAMTPTNFNF